MGIRSNRLAEAVRTSTHNLCFEQNYEKYQNFYLKFFNFLVKVSIYLNRRVFVMKTNNKTPWSITECIICLVLVNKLPVVRFCVLYMFIYILSPSMVRTYLGSRTVLAIGSSSH